MTLHERQNPNMTPCYYARLNGYLNKCGNFFYVDICI